MVRLYAISDGLAGKQNSSRSFIGRKEALTCICEWVLVCRALRRGEGGKETDRIAPPQPRKLALFSSRRRAEPSPTLESTCRNIVLQNRQGLYAVRKAPLRDGRRSLRRSDCQGAALKPQLDIAHGLPRRVGHAPITTMEGPGRHGRRSGLARSSSGCFRR